MQRIKYAHINNHCVKENKYVKSMGTMMIKNVRPLIRRSMEPVVQDLKVMNVLMNFISYVITQIMVIYLFALSIGIILVHHNNQNVGGRPSVRSMELMALKNVKILIFRCTAPHAPKDRRMNALKIYYNAMILKKAAFLNVSIVKVSSAMLALNKQIYMYVLPTLLAPITL